MKTRGLTWFTQLVMLLGTAILINFAGVMFASMYHWFPRVAAGHMTFPQVFYAEWVWYYTSHRFSWIVGSDLPGLAFIALIVLLAGYFKWYRRNRRAADIVDTEPGFTRDGTSVWPPAPKK